MCGLESCRANYLTDLDLADVSKVDEVKGNVAIPAVPREGFPGRQRATRPPGVGVSVLPQKREKESGFVP